MLEIRAKLKKIPLRFYILLAIILVGIFLRTYHFHDWMNFEADQVRDAQLIEGVLSDDVSLPLWGPTMRKSEDESGNLFKIGPVYYYMQALSGYLFGNEPHNFAYPDLFFAILSIPLFYLFFRKYFERNLTLAITGLYSISYFIVRYSRFAWNPNLIPFFTLLYLLSLIEIINNGKKTNKLYYILCGVSIGIGVQLHIFILLLFPAMAMLILAFLLKNKSIYFKDILLTIFITILLNGFPLYSEITTKFSNTKIFFNSVQLSENSDKPKFSEKILNSLDCQVESHFHMISSRGSDKCNYSYIKLFQEDKSKKLEKEIKSYKFIYTVIIAFLFSFFGYFYFIFKIVHEKNVEKKHFLWLVGIYALLSFLIMLPVSEKTFNNFRYFMHIFFIPYIFLGFFMAMAKKRKILQLLIIFIFIGFFFSNIYTNFSVGKELFKKNKSDIHYSILGEMEDMVNYMIKESDGKKNLYLIGDYFYAIHFYKQFAYIANRQGVNIIKKEKNDNKKIHSEDAIFYVDDYKDFEKNKKDNELGGCKISNSRIFGKIIVYELVK